MCVDKLGEIKVAEADIDAYKLVHKGTKHYSSAFAPDERSSQYNDRRVGRLRIYKLGRTHHSPMDRTPGFYCYATLSGAKFKLGDGQVILKVRIPAGTRYRHAELWGYPDYPPWPVVLAERLIVLKEVDFLCEKAA